MTAHLGSDGDLRGSALADFEKWVTILSYLEKGGRDESQDHRCLLAYS